jgi:hypothetical protein
VTRIVGRLRQDALLDQPLEPVGKDIGCDAFHRLGEELAEMPSVTEDDVADDDEAPSVTQHFEGKIDRAGRAMCVVHGNLARN